MKFNKIAVILSTLDRILKVMQICLTLTNAKSILKIASTAMFVSLRRGRVLHLLVDIMLDIFNKTVSSVAQW